MSRVVTSVYILLTSLVGKPDKQAPSFLAVCFCSRDPDSCLSQVDGEMFKIRFFTNEVHIKDGGLSSTPYERELRCASFWFQKKSTILFHRGFGPLYFNIFRFSNMGTFFSYFFGLFLKKCPRQNGGIWT